MSEALKYCFSFLFLLLFGLQTFGQETPPKRELRGVWIATVGNIDWPSKKGLSAHQQQQEFIRYLDYFQSLGFNAVIVQIRPAADAFYPSPYEPWSVYLSGKQGLAPFPHYDPLIFMVQETHRRNMEFHAWFNPFRALVNSGRNPNPTSHVTHQHPEWLINYGGKTYFDPGNPEARLYIQKVILDVVKRYDIDAVHIDDYFYPYKIAGQTFNDQVSFSKYNNGMPLDTWRRNNVNLFISQLNRLIKKEKSWMQFGVSPFGIWRNQKQDPNGSRTNGTSCYDDLYSDVLLWSKSNWVDYLAPQIYWPRSSRLASFSVLLPWWKQHQNRDHLYIGLGLYKMVGAGASSPWYGPNEILSQIKMGRQHGTDGFIFYSASIFNKIGPALADSLRNRYFSTIALPPAKPWLSQAKPPSPKLYSSWLPQKGLLLEWESPKGLYETSSIKYLLYRFKQNEKINLEDPRHIIALSGDTRFLDRDYLPGKNYRYVVTAVNRFWNESAASNLIEEGH